MKKPGYDLISRILIIGFAVLIALCFGVSVVTIERHAKEDCFNHIEEITEQVADMFNHALLQSEDQLMLFADILASNSSMEEALLIDYMKNFCDTQSFDAVCLHRQDGTSASYGAHPAHVEGAFILDAEAASLPYVSGVHAVGDKRSEQYVYIAVPVVKGEITVAVLYGYISLDVFPSFVSSTAYGGKCQFYIVDGKTGDFLMDEYHRYAKDSEEELPLGNVFDGSMADRETKPGYHIENMRKGIAKGSSGYHIFKSQRTGQWYYTYFMPMGINHWSMQMTIDEPTAFSTYHDVRKTMFIQMTCVSALALGILAVVVWQGRMRRKNDVVNLHKADYLNAVQSALITAHNNPDFVGQALKVVAGEVKAGKALLLTFDGHTISNIYYWPSLDMSKAKVLVGVNAQEAFPVMFDALVSNESFFCDEETIAKRFTPLAKDLFRALDVNNILLVPVADNLGVLRGAVAALNMNGDVRSPEMLELVTRDFYMAINNLENHNIIRKMGTIDYLTGIKNRNSFETESPTFETMPGESLWCVYVDVNGLHEMNNEKGHPAGDALLCAVAAAVKKIYGAEHSYRLGGDEFIAFKLNSSHDAFMNCKYRLLDELAKKGYSASVGFESVGRNENGVFDVARVMAEAEAIMYQEKQRHYQALGNPSGRKTGK